MSRGFEHFWQYGIRCDHPGCKASLWRTGVSEQIAYTLAQRDAKAAGWKVTRDRLHELNAPSVQDAPLTADLCREHARWP